MDKILSEIDVRSYLKAKDFWEEYLLTQTPVVIKGVTSEWQALRKWNLEYFASTAPNICITAKKYTNNGVLVEQYTMGEYVSLLSRRNMFQRDDVSAVELPYCHDIPIFCLKENLVNDILPFPLEFLPSWYRSEWWKYMQFFMGPSKSLTPLHFDCLLTNNLFFQVSGRKRFTLLSYKEGKYCGRSGWRWYELDPENPDFDRYPYYKDCHPVTIVVNPGDILFMPAGTLHHVRSLDESISFNIDFHTTKTSLNGVFAIARGMPVRNFYYNFLSSLGLILKIPSRIIFPFYKSYLNYVS